MFTLDEEFRASGPVKPGDAIEIFFVSGWVRTTVAREPAQKKGCVNVVSPSAPFPGSSVEVSVHAARRVLP